MIVARMVLGVYDGSALAPIFPEKAAKPSDATAAYLASVAEKLMHADASRTTRVAPGSAQEEQLMRFIRMPFFDAASALLRAMDETMQALSIAREGFDLALFSFDLDDAPHLCVARLVYRRAVVHRVDVQEGVSRTALETDGAALPPPGAKECAGFVVNLSTGEIRLRDVAVQTDAGERMLFGEALFAMEQTHTTRQAVKKVTEAIAKAAPDVPQETLTPAVKRAMSRSIEEKGAIDVQDVVDEVFRSDPEREAIIAEVAQQMQQEQVAPVIPVENKRVAAQMQRVKIRTDTGISITLPRALADDERSFAVVKQADGTISILIGQVQEIRTE